jgi:hypothetical protein
VLPLDPDAQDLVGLLASWLPRHDTPEAAEEGTEKLRRYCRRKRAVGLPRKNPDEVATTQRVTVEGMRPRVEPQADGLSPVGISHGEQDHEKAGGGKTQEVGHGRRGGAALTAPTLVLAVPADATPDEIAKLASELEKQVPWWAAPDGSPHSQGTQQPAT